MFNAAFYPGAALISVSTADVPVDHAFFSQALKAECPALVPGLRAISHSFCESPGTPLPAKIKPARRNVA